VSRKAKTPSGAPKAGAKTTSWLQREKLTQAKVSSPALEAAKAAAEARVHPRLVGHWLRVCKDSASWNRARSHYQDLLPFLADFAEVLLTALTRLQPELDPSDLVGFVTDHTTRARRQLLQKSWSEARWQPPATSPCSELDSAPFLSLPYRFRNTIRAAILSRVQRHIPALRAEFLKRRARAAREPKGETVHHGPQAQTAPLRPTTTLDRTRRRELLKRYRQDQSLTMAALARRAATSVSAIQGMVRGDRTRYGEDTLARFLKAIGVPAEKW